MIHHHSSGKRGLWKRIFSMCIALVLICGVTVPASVSASGSADGADGVPAPETTYNFYLDGKEYASQTVKDGETLSDPETPTAEGKTFDAWYTEMEGGEKFTDFSVQTVTETKAVFLYGRWQEADTADTENPEASEDTEIPESPETPEPGDPQEPGEGEPGQQPNQEIENGETNTENQQLGTPETDEDENTDSESDEDETAYEQRAMAVLALYGEEAAFRADENIDLSYFEIYVDGSLYDNEVTGTVETGPISGESVPSIIGYEFIVATIDGIKVESVGTLTYENQEYVYYTTEGSATSLAAMVLEEGKTIRLNYETPKEEYSIGYTVTGGEYSADNIFNAERPVTVTGGESYAFRVNIPRGYSATVLVNEQTVGTLGTEPTYKQNGNFIEVAENSPAEVLTLTGTYEIENVNSDQNVEVQLQQRNTYTFNAQLWTETEYAKGRADFGEPTRNFSGVDEGKKTQIWEFKTNNSSNVNWVLDSLQINGTKLEIPYGDYKSLPFWESYPTVSKTTELPSGTFVTVALTDVDRERTVQGYKYTRTYTVSVSNCYENITITGGNLVNSDWPEIIPKTLTGVEVFQVKCPKGFHLGRLAESEKKHEEEIIINEQK